MKDLGPTEYDTKYMARTLYQAYLEWVEAGRPGLERKDRDGGREGDDEKEGVDE